MAYVQVAVGSSPPNRSEASGIGSGGGGEQGNCAKRPGLVREWTPLAFVCSLISWITSMCFDFLQGDFGQRSQMVEVQ